ncbi:Vms1/Ankzf1 family peptidyl-tRNA hydrolase [Chloroflexota bacterium]
MHRSKMLEFLGEIEQTPDPGAISLYIPPGLLELEINDLLQKSEALLVPDELSQLVSSSKNGAVLFYGNMRKCLVFPPFPLSKKATFDGYITEPFRLLLTTDFMIGLVLVHLGSYAVGICQGEKLTSSKVGTGLVHGRHKKGGSSQQRFQRRRDNQIREFMDRVCLHTRKQLEPYAQLLNYIVYGGPHHTVLLLQKRCPFLQSFEDRVLPSLEVPSLRQRVLETAIGRIWSTYIIDWEEE